MSLSDSRELTASIPATLQVFILDAVKVLPNPVLQHQALHMLQQLIDGVDVGVN